MVMTEVNYKNFAHNTKVMHKALSRKCCDCRLHWHPLVMTFDHRERSSKVKNPSAFRTVSPSAFKRELDKCDVVCRNCHQIREYLRDAGHIDISPRKKAQYNYYASLVKWLTHGALIRPDTYEYNDKEFPSEANINASGHRIKAGSRPTEDE